MKSLLVMVIICISSNLFSAEVVKSDKTNLEIIDFQIPILKSTGGGNGGDTVSIDLNAIRYELRRVSDELISFLISTTGQELYEHLDTAKTIELLSDTEVFKIVTMQLRDKFLVERDAVNYPSELKVFLNAKSLEEAIGTKAIYVLVLHEVFGIQGIETNNAESSVQGYIESIKLFRYIHSDKIYSLKDYLVNKTYAGVQCVLKSNDDKRKLVYQSSSYGSRVIAYKNKKSFVSMFSNGSVERSKAPIYEISKSNTSFELSDEGIETSSELKIINGNHYIFSASTSMSSFDDELSIQNIKKGTQRVMKSAVCKHIEFEDQHFNLAGGTIYGGYPAKGSLDSARDFDEVVKSF